MQRLSFSNLARLLAQLPRPWVAALLVALVLATPGQSQLRLFDRRDEELALRSELSVLTSQLGAVEQVLSELVQGSSQPDNLLNVLDQLNRQDGFVLSATITAMQDRLRNAEGALSEEEMANLRLSYEEAQRRYVRVQSLRARIARQMSAKADDQTDGQNQGLGQGQNQSQVEGQVGGQAGDASSNLTGQDQANQNSDSIERLKEDARRLTSQLSRSQEQLKAAQEAALKAEAALAKRRSEAEQLGQALRQTQSKLDDSQTNAAELRQALQALEGERQSLAAEVAQSQARYLSAEQALNQAQSQQQARALELAAVLGRAEQAEAALARAEEAMQQDDDQARQALLQRERDLAALQDSLAGLNQTLSDQQGQLEGLLTERNALQQAVAERNQALVAARLAQAEIRDAIQAQVADQKASIDRLKLALSQRDAELALTATALEGKQEALAATLGRIAIMEGEAEGLATTVSELEAHVMRARDEAEAAKAQQTALEQAVAEANGRARGLEAQLAAMEAQATRSAQQVAANSQALDQARALADERLRQLDAPRLKLPEQVAWSFEARFGSLGHRLSAAQKRDLKRALASKPAGGCLVIAASADPRPIKSGYSIATNSELAALRALGLLRGLQSLDKAAAQDSLILGLADFQNLEQEAAEQRSAKVVWLPQACSVLLDKSGAPDPQS